MKGVPVDMSRYIAQNEDTVAIGNGKMNARGDQLGRGGKIVKERDAVAREYHQARGPKAVKQVALKDLRDEVMQSGPTLAAEQVEFVSPSASSVQTALSDAQSSRFPRKRKLKDDGDEVQAEDKPKKGKDETDE